MNKSLLALAVAAALPTLAQAQTTVTVSGIIKTGVQSVKLSNNALAADNGNSMAVNDGSSRFIIAGSEIVSIMRSRIASRPSFACASASSSTCGVSPEILMSICRAVMPRVVPATLKSMSPM